MNNLKNSTSLAQKFVSPENQFKAEMDERLKSRRDYVEGLIKDITEIDEYALNQCAWTFLEWIRENGIDMNNVKPALRKVFEDYQNAINRKVENPLKVVPVTKEDLIDVIKMMLGRDGFGIGMKFSDRIAAANEILDQVEAEKNG